MKNSTKKHISEIIEKDSCPFTEYEIFGFFTGILVSAYPKKVAHEKIIKFLDLNEKSLPLADKLLEDMRLNLHGSSYEIYNGDDNDFDKKALSISEWAYYFLISYNRNFIQNDNTEILEILDIFDEISQIKQKYRLDERENVTKESLNDIDSFLVKSTLYLFNKSNDK
tara:strand:+ start:1114 stop:1617 length:504 start_codon:yes stop_codon:yes gene_type:complete